MQVEAGREFPYKHIHQPEHDEYDHNGADNAMHRRIDRELAQEPEEESYNDENDYNFYQESR
jgi:hypothetical protein